MTAETITYPEMNAKLVDLLRWDKGNSMLLYAAQRIEELERVASVRGECLAIAIEALRSARYNTTLSVIERRLAELEPEEEAG
jgi:hypothetical protein